MNKIKRYFRGVWEQAKMVRWPKRKDLFQSVGIVLMVVAVAAIALTISDGIISQLLQTLDKQFNSAKDSASAIGILPMIF